ncbi:MarR family transcriptional regulator [Phytoactinopolyspora mesophila]|uniref:MarR family transcriptional regulator n=1 Tax=Phytoactinopolyspora mesophila TaxID=2650750 RepID=UPI001391D017
MNNTRRETSGSNGRTRAEEAALRATRRLHAATEALFDAAAEQYGINRNDLRCLEILEREGPTRPSSLAETSGLSPAAITKILDRLERAGYITRTEGPDRRARTIATSDRHRRRRREIWEPVAEAATAALAGRDSEQIEALTELLDDLAEANGESARRLRGA